MKSLAGVRQLYKAPPGLHGTKQRQHGRAGRDAVVLVPVGTVVQRLRQPGDAPAPASAATEEQQQGGEEEEDVPEWLRRWRQPFSGAEYSSGSDGGSSDSDSDADEERGDASYAGAGGGAARAAQQAQQDPQQQYQLLADLVEDGQEVVAARGGRGGRGNAGLKATPSRPAPAEPGQVSRGLGWAAGQRRRGSAPGLPAWPWRRGHAHAGCRVPRQPGPAAGATLGPPCPPPARCRSRVSPGRKSACCWS